MAKAEHARLPEAEAAALANELLQWRVQVDQIPALCRKLDHHNNRIPAGMFSANISALERDVDFTLVLWENCEKKCSALFSSSGVTVKDARGRRVGP